MQRRHRPLQGALESGGMMAGPGGRAAPGHFVSVQEFKSLASLVHDVDERLRRLETLLFHIPVPDIQRIIKMIEAAALDAEVPESQPELELGPEPEEVHQEATLLTIRELSPADLPSSFAHSDCSSADATQAPGDSYAAQARAPKLGGVHASESLARQSQAQQEFKDNVLGTAACRLRPQVGEIWRFTCTSRIFQLFDDEKGRAATSRMGPTQGTCWREESKSYPQLVSVVAAPPNAELLEVRGRGETASWLKGWVKLWDARGRSLLELDTY